MQHHIAFLKGTVSRDFRHIFYQKIPPGPHMNKKKLIREIFHFLKEIRGHGHRLRWHDIRGHVSV